MSDDVGAVSEVWRYPVKSMMGERLPAATLTELGVPGDRAWAVRDEVRGGIRGAKKIASLMTLAARYRDEPAGDGTVSPIEIDLPDGTTVTSDDPDRNRLLSAALDHEVTLWPRLPADALDHYRRGAPDSDDLLAELRQIFGRLDDEPLPDLTGFPPEILEYESPLGTYFDAFPLLLLTTASLAALQALVPEAEVDVRRFRPNLVVDTGSAEGFVEQGWTGRRLRVGGAELEVTVGCPRCVMVTRGFADLGADPTILRAIVRDADQILGVYANVVRPGPVAEGDRVEVLA